MTAEIIDADNHYYEPRDAFTRYIDPEYRDRAIRPVANSEGVEQIFVGDRVYTYTGTQYDHAPVPGGLRTMLGQFSRGEIDGFFDSAAQTPMRPEYQNRDARLHLMDQQGLSRCMMFPTLAPCVEHFLKDDIGLTYASVDAFNRWVEDDWGFAHADRIYSAAYVSLLDLDQAIVQLESLIDRGVRVLYLRPGPQGRRSPADPYFDPFWARVAEAGLLVTFHSSESGYNEMFSVFWGEQANPESHHQSAFQWTNFFGDRPIMDTMSALVLHNLFGRFPTLRVASIENGSLWVSYLLKAMDKMVGMGRFGTWLGGEISGRPSEIFKEHVYVSPFHEEPIVELARVLGHERVIFGSDFPHAEGLAEPADFVRGLDGLNQDQIDLIMGGNVAALLGSAA